MGRGNSTAWVALALFAAAGCQAGRTEARYPGLPPGTWRAFLPAEGEKPAVGFEITGGPDATGTMIVFPPDRAPDFAHAARTSLHLRQVGENEFQARVSTLRWTDAWTFRFTPSRDPSVRQAVMIEANNPEAVDPEACTFVRQPAAPGAK